MSISNLLTENDYKIFTNEITTNKIKTNLTPNRLVATDSNSVLTTASYPSGGNIVLNDQSNTYNSGTVQNFTGVRFLNNQNVAITTDNTGLVQGIPVGGFADGSIATYNINSNLTSNYPVTSDEVIIVQSLNDTLVNFVDTTTNQTIGGNKTFSGTTNISTLSASQLVSTNASKNLISTDPATFVQTTGNQNIGGIKSFTSQLLLQTGSAVTPSIAFISEPANNTGFYYPGVDNQIAMCNGGTVSWLCGSTQLIMSRQLTMNGFQIATLPTPLASDNAANKGYVDARSSCGTWAPTFSALSNVTSVTNSVSAYTYNYNGTIGIYRATCRFTVNITATGACGFTMSIPTAATVVAGNGMMINNLSNSSWGTILGSISTTIDVSAFNNLVSGNQSIILQFIWY